MFVRKLSLIYALSDFLMSILSWTIFIVLSNNGETSEKVAFLFSLKEYTIGLLCIPAGWTVIFFFSGFYSVSLTRSRLEEFVLSISVTMLGTLILYFIFLSKGLIPFNLTDIVFLKTILLLQFSLTYLPRLLITSIILSKVRARKIGYKTMIVGSGCKALNIMDSIRDEKNPGGNLLIGYVRINGEISLLQDDKITDLGEVTYLQEIIKKNKIEEVIIAIEGNGYLKICEIINTLTFSDVRIKTIPSIYDILTGRVNHTTIYATPLLEISNRSLPLWQSFFKIILDYAIAVFSLIVMSPVMLILAILIKFSGKGTVIYSHQRIGKNGKPFTIYKFRSMYINSENGVPLLSGINDSRITPVGQFMRRHRLDELPNLINVIKGEMSIVGPRPERQHFIDQIVKKAPHYRRLHKVKPGLTSWGQVKYGYASNVDMMIERLQYDLLYVKNMSVLIDLKIILYTILIILKGKGI